MLNGVEIIVETRPRAAEPFFLWPTVDEREAAAADAADQAAKRRPIRSAPSDDDKAGPPR